MLLIRTVRTNFSKILNEIHTFSFKKMNLKMRNGDNTTSASVLTVKSAVSTNTMEALKGHGKFLKTVCVSPN